MFNFMFSYFSNFSILLSALDPPSEAEETLFHIGIFLYTCKCNITCKCNTTTEWDVASTFYLPDTKFWFEYNYIICLYCHA